MLICWFSGLFVGAIDRLISRCRGGRPFPRIFTRKFLDLGLGKMPDADKCDSTGAGADQLVQLGA